MNTDNFSLVNLIKLVPIDEQLRSDLLVMEPSFTADEKYRLSKMCWLILRLIKREEYKDKVIRALDEIAEGKRVYNLQEFESFEKELILELDRRLSLISTEDELAGIKKQLNEAKTNILTQNSGSSPLPQKT